MGKLIGIGFLLLATGYAFAQQKVSLDSSYANGYYVERLKLFEQLPHSKNGIVFLGNSITEVGEWNKLIVNQNVVNRGISGDNSYGVLARLDEVLSSKPKKIFLMIGVNDIKRGTPIKHILGNQEKIVKKIIKESPRTTLYVQSVLPVTESVLASIYDLIRNNKIRKLNEGLKEICQKYTTEYIDLNQNVFSDAQGEMKSELTTDGLHLKPEAYLLWVSYLLKMNYL